MTTRNLAQRLGLLGALLLLGIGVSSGAAAERALRAVDATIARGQTNCIAVVLDSLGNENAAGFSLCFDTNALRFVSVRPKPAGSPLSLNINSNQASAGRLGIAASLAFGESFPAGSHLLVEICFRAAAGDGIVTTPLSFCDLPIAREVADADANGLPTLWPPGTVTLAGDCRYALESDHATFEPTGGFGAAGVATSVGCPWTALSSNAWITVSSPSNGTGSGPFTYQVSPNPSMQGRTGAVWVAGQPHRIIQQGIFCDFNLATPLRVHPPEGGQGQVSLTGNSACTWTVQNPHPWITLTSASTGSGDAILDYLLSPHTGFQARTGLVSVAGLTLTIVQLPIPCTFTLTPTSRVHTAVSEFNTVDVSGPAGCDWTIDNRNDWILIKLTTNGTGDGIARYTVLANDRPVTRSGIITVAGLPFTVQQLPAPCSVSLLQTGQLVGALGGTGIVQFATLNECPWTALNTNAWIELPPVSEGVGGGALGWRVGPNFSNSERTGHVTIAGKAFRITQYPTLCSSSISPTSRSITSGINTGNVTVSISSACSNVQWRVYNPNPWITVYSGPEGYQKGTVRYSVEAFQDYGTRTGYLHIADRRFTLTQSGIPCTYAVSPTSRSHGYLPETNTISFAVSGLCSWRATSSAPWLVLQSPATGQGSTTLIYRTLLNTGATRSATITAQGRTFTVSQGAATPVSITTQPVAQNVALGSTAQFTVIAAGTAPLAYQWRRNGIPLAGATAATLLLSTVQPAQAGNYSVVISNLRGSVTSTEVPLRINTPPSLEPIAKRTVVPGALVAFTAQASDSDSPPQTLTFSLGPGAPAGAVIQPGSGAFSWTVPAGQPPGPIPLTVRVTDSGVPALTTTRTLTLQVTAGFSTNRTWLPFGALWRYRDTGEDLGSAWTRFDYADAGWSAGPAPLGYGNGNEATVVNYGPSTSSRYITTYFRTTFTVHDPAMVTALTLRFRRDDGVVFHLNGTELFRENMPAGPITHATLAASGLGTADEAIVVVSPALDPERLRPGPNVLAVEVHNRAPDSGDIAIDVELSGVEAVAAPFLPTEPTSLTVSEQEPARFSVRAASALPVRHQWFFNTQALPGQTNAFLEWPAASLELQGSYQVVVANALGSVTSQVATLTVLPLPNRPPVIAPIANRLLAPGQDLGVKVYAFDQDYPPQQLSFTLEAGAPAGAWIHPDSGLLTWNALAGSPVTNLFTVRVTDSGTPPRVARMSFQAVIVPSPRLLSMALTRDRQPVLTWESQPGFRYQVEESTELFGVWKPLPGEVKASGQAASFLIPAPAATASSQRFYRVRVLE